MIRINFNMSVEMPKWWWRLFLCKHNVVSVTENAFTRYGTKTSYMYCQKCGRKAMDISRNCDHKLNDFGICVYCNDRVKMHKGPHVWNEEPDTDDKWCDKCGEWKDNVDQEYE